MSRWAIDLVGALVLLVVLSLGMSLLMFHLVVTPSTKSGVSIAVVQKLVTPITVYGSLTGQQPFPQCCFCSLQQARANFMRVALPAYALTLVIPALCGWAICELFGRD